MFFVVREMGCNNITGKPPERLPLGGKKKLSPQVTDEGKTSGSISPHPARVRATFFPKGEGFPAAIPAMQSNGKIAK